MPPRSQPDTSTLAEQRSLLWQPLTVSSTQRATYRDGTPSPWSITQREQPDPQCQNPTDSESGTYDLYHEQSCLRASITIEQARSLAQVLQDDLDATPSSSAVPADAVNATIAVINTLLEQLTFAECDGCGVSHRKHSEYGAAHLRNELVSFLQPDPR
jgi:hypothetical protein